MNERIAAKSRFEHSLAVAVVTGSDAVDDTVVPELATARVNGLAHPVAEDDDEITGVQRNGLVLERRVLEQPHDQTAGRQATHARRG